MIGLVAISVLGALILILCIRLVVHSRNRRQPVTTNDYTNARETLDSAFTETETIKRIFSIEDAEFIDRSAVPQLERLFLYERRKLAMQWLRKTQNQVARLMDLHLQLASYTHDPSARFELILAIKYLAFKVASNITLVLIWLFGPFRVTLAASYTIRSAANFCRTFSLRLERVDRTRLSSGRESLVH
jgi:hypothetical protein